MWLNCFSFPILYFQSLIQCYRWCPQMLTKTNWNGEELLNIWTISPPPGYCRHYVSLSAAESDRADTAIPGKDWVSYTCSDQCVSNMFHFETFYLYICDKVTLHDFSSHFMLLVKYNNNNNNNNNFLENFALKYCWPEHKIYYLLFSKMLYYLL